MVRIDIAAVRAAIVERDLDLEPENHHLQSAVREHLPAVIEQWVGTGDVDPYGALADSDHAFAWPGADLNSAELIDIRSAYCHTIRQAVERVTGVDPSSSRGSAELHL